MRTFFLVLVAVLSTSAALAAPPSRSKPDYATPSADRLPPAKSAGNPCAAFGPGFVKVEGTDTCMKIGGSFSADVAATARPR
jgi:hypothetical protein